VGRGYLQLLHLALRLPRDPPAAGGARLRSPRPWRARASIQRVGEPNPHRASGRIARDRGMHRPQIGARLFMSLGTVKTHLSHIYAQLSVTNRTELATRIHAERSPHARGARIPRAPTAGIVIQATSTAARTTPRGPTRAHIGSAYSGFPRGSTGRPAALRRESRRSEARCRSSSPRYPYG
jgi:hypothetical protein